MEYTNALAAIIFSLVRHTQSHAQQTGLHNRVHNKSNKIFYTEYINILAVINIFSCGINNYFTK